MVSVKKFSKRVICGSVAAVLATSLSLNASANTLAAGPVVANTDFAMFGVSGLRGVGAGDITVSGVSGTVTRAILVWHGVSNSTSPLSRSATIGASSFPGTDLGVSSDNDWGETASQAFQADVTSVVTGNG
ncbi:MAG: hypothetical protein ACRCWJ_07980, partial [Casimicrobium sp.]